MSNTGYQIIDLKNNNLTNGAEFTIGGIYNTLVNSHSKPIYVTGLTMNTTKLNDAFATNAYVYGTSYVVEVVGATLTISNADVISVSID